MEGQIKRLKLINRPMYGRVNLECRNTAHWMAQRTARKLPELDEQQPLRIVDFDKFNDDNRDGGVWMLAHEIRLKIGRQGKRIRTQNFVSVRCATTYMEPDEFSRVPLGSANPDVSGRQPMASRKNEGMPRK